MNLRVTILSLDLGMSFSILALYVSSVTVIFLVVLLITASVVAAKTDDLTAMRQGKTMLLLMIVFAIFVYAIATSVFSLVGTSIFYGLMFINVGFLLAYIVMRRFRTPASLPRKLNRR
jgi:amino acid transporter